MWKRFVPGSCGSARTVMVTGLRELTGRDMPCLCSTVTTSISSSSETTDINKPFNTVATYNRLYIIYLRYIDSYKNRLIKPVLKASVTPDQLGSNITIFRCDLCLNTIKYKDNKY